MLVTGYPAKTPSSRASKGLSHRREVVARHGPPEHVLFEDECSSVGFEFYHHDHTVHGPPLCLFMFTLLPRCRGWFP